MMYSTFAYNIWSVLNLLVFCYCCKQWKTVGNIKFLVASQAVLSLLAILPLHLLQDSVNWFPKGKFLCYQLPSLAIFFLCLAIFNLTCLACVRYAQVTYSCHLRRSSAILMILGSFGFSILLFSPIFYNMNKGCPIFGFDGCMGNASNIGDTKVAKTVHISVAHYLFWLLVLQFILPAFIIVSRLVLLFNDSLQDKEESTEDTPPKTHNQQAIRYTVNAIFAIFFVVTTVFLSLHKSLDDMDSDEALAFLNLSFQKASSCFLAVLGYPWFLAEIIRSQSSKNGENSCLKLEYTKQDKLNI